ncbi:MAG: precorrin-6y C5,15-methyltransferase (decarboxylating) subunit CbiE [Chloroflexi bacterium]|nr:precorrin-6y C5,15-methyltransferase (decarboxylating) subunit CbiE [Chloroflexota bacterium]
MPQSSISVVGLGADGPSGLGSRALDLVNQATILCGGERHLDYFADHPARRFVVKSNLRELATILEAERQSGRPVVLASGDPGCFGLVAFLRARFGREALEVVPNVSSFQLAFARLGEPWHDAHLLSAHGRPLGPVVREALHSPKFAVLTDSTNTPAAVAAALLDAGLPDAPAWVLENLGASNERLTATSLAKLEGQSFDPLNVLVVLRDSVPPRRYVFARPETDYLHSRGLITKAEVRAVSLGKLRLAETDLVWDVGAGCGSVGIEAAALAWRGTVWAVERNPEQIDHIRANVTRHRVVNLEIVAGSAPDALGDLPDPDAVFVGGAGPELRAVLAVSRDRLRPGGRFVLNAATFETAGTTLDFLRASGWPADLTQISAARGADLLGHTRLAALNPVFVIAATKPAEAR